MLRGKLAAGHQTMSGDLYMVVIAVGSAYDERDKYKSTFARDAELVAGFAGRGGSFKGRKGAAGTGWPTEMDGAMGLHLSHSQEPSRATAALHQSAAATTERVQHGTATALCRSRTAAWIATCNASWHSATTAQLPASGRSSHLSESNSIVTGPAHCRREADAAGFSGRVAAEAARVKE